MEKVVSDLNIFVWKLSKIAAPFFFFADFAFQNMVETTLPNGLETTGRRVYRLFCHISRRFWVFAFWMIFSVFQKKSGFGVFSVHPETTLPDGLETSGRRAYR